MLRKKSIIVIVAMSALAAVFLANSCGRPEKSISVLDLAVSPGPDHYSLFNGRDFTGWNIDRNRSGSGCHQKCKTDVSVSAIACPTLSRDLCAAAEISDPNEPGRGGWHSTGSRDLPPSPHVQRPWVQFSTKRTDGYADEHPNRLDGGRYRQHLDGTRD